jgi:hypothetical protein
VGGSLVRVEVDVGELGRDDQHGEDRGGRQVRHAERLADEIAARADLGLDLVERGAHDLTRLLDGLRPDPEAPFTARQNNGARVSSRRVAGRSRP